MAEGPVYVILDMITLILKNTTATVMSLVGLSGSLIDSLSLVLGVGGGLGLVIVIAILALVGFFVVRFLFGSMKTIAMLMLAGLAILAFLFIGSAFV